MLYYTILYKGAFKYLVITRRLVSDDAHALSVLHSESKSYSSSAVYITPTGLPPPSVGRGT